MIVELHEVLLLLIPELHKELFLLIFGEHFIDDLKGRFLAFGLRVKSFRI